MFYAAVTLSYGQGHWQWNEWTGKQQQWQHQQTPMQSFTAVIFIPFEKIVTLISETQTNITKQANRNWADKYPPSHFSPFNCCLSVFCSLKKGLTSKIRMSCLAITNSDLFDLLYIRLESWSLTDGQTAERPNNCNLYVHSDTCFTTVKKHGA